MRPPSLRLPHCYIIILTRRSAPLLGSLRPSQVNEEFKKIGNIKYLNDLEREGKVKQFERVFVRRVGESEEMTEEME